MSRRAARITHDEAFRMVKGRARRGDLFAKDAKNYAPGGEAIEDVLPMPRPGRG